MPLVAGVRRRSRQGREPPYQSDTGRLDAPRRAACPAPAAFRQTLPGHATSPRLIVAGAVFVSGAVVLGMEIAASRVLAPFFGNSLYVWGALIGVVLAGLALGYWAGGWLADRWPTPHLLAAVMGLGALFVLAIPVLDERVLEAIVDWDPGPRLNPLLAADCALRAPAAWSWPGSRRSRSGSGRAR